MSTRQILQSLSQSWEIAPESDMADPGQNPGFRFDFRVQKALLSHRPHPILCMESWKKLSVVRKNLGKSFSGYKSNVYQTDFAIVTTGLRNRASKWHGRSRSKSGFQVEIQYWDGTSGSQTWFHFVHGKWKKCSVARKNLGEAFSEYKSNVYQTDFAVAAIELRNRASKSHGRSKSKSGLQAGIRGWDATSESQTSSHFVHGK